MRKIQGFPGKRRLVTLFAAGLLAACAPGAGNAPQPAAPEATVTPLPLSSPVVIPTVTSAPEAAASSAAGQTPAPAAAAAAAQAVPGPLFQLAPGNVVTVTHVFSAGAQTRTFDGQSVRVAGQEVSILFTYQVSGTAQVQTTALDPAHPAPGALAVAEAGSSPASITPDTLQAASDKVGFTVRAPVWLPPGYAPATAGLSFSTGQHWAWQQYYAVWGTRKFVWLELTQQSRQAAPVWNPATGLGQVGAGAQVQAAQVKGQPAEYVAGGWTRQTTVETAQGQVRVNQKYQWSSPQPASAARLRWAQGEFWYEVVFHGECWQYLCGDKDTLVKIAEALP